MSSNNRNKILICVRHFQFLLFDLIEKFMHAAGFCRPPLQNFLSILTGFPQVENFEVKISVKTN